MESPGKPSAASPPSYDGLHRRQRIPLLPGVAPRPPFRTLPPEDMDPIESTGMRRTASYSSFLSKKSGPLYKQTLQHTRTLSGQMNVSDLYTQAAGQSSAVATTAATSADDSLPTTLTKTPTYEYYGFVLYLVSGITYFMYLAWAYLPKEMLDSLGITYYPSKYWALALPIWLFVLVIYLYIVFFAVNLYNTASFDSFHTITDDHATPLETTSSAALTDDFVPDLMDIPIGLVNAALYQHIEGISDDEDEMDDELGYWGSGSTGAGAGRIGGEDTFMMRTADGIEVEIDDDEEEFDVDDDDEEDEEEEDEEEIDDEEEEEEEGFKLDGTNLSDWDDFAHHDQEGNPAPPFR